MEGETMRKITLAALAIAGLAGGTLAGSFAPVMAQDNAARITCQKAKANTLAICLSDAANDVRQCQGNCEGDPDDPGAYNDCRRVCSNEEQKDRAVCFDADKKVVCP
jgi:hypothetical protein